MQLWEELCLLVNYRHDISDSTGLTILHMSLRHNLISLVSAILNDRKQYNVDANLKDKTDQTPLSWAAREGHEAVVKLLLAQPNVEADSKDVLGHTPLSLTALSGHEAMVKLLLAQSDVEADSKKKSGQTPLSLTAWSGHEAVVKLLLAHPNVDINSKDQEGRTPLWWPASEGHEGLVQLLKLNGAQSQQPTPAASPAVLPDGRDSPP